MSEVATNLWSHQAEGIKRATSRKNFALFWEMGTGKTRTQIEILRCVFNREKKILPTLILAPPIVVPNWKNEIEKFSKIPAKKVVTLYGPQKKRVEVFNKLREYYDGNMIVVTNFEAMLMENLYKSFTDWKPEVIVLDEAHKIKSHQASRTKKVLKLGANTTYKYILTGTPVLNSLLDLHPQFLFLDGGERLGESFYSFRNRYFYDRNSWMNQNHFPDWRPQEGAAELIKEKIADISMVVNKKDCLDLPPLIRQTIYVGMSPEQERAYEEMKKDFLTYVEGGVCVASIALTKALRLQQIVSGHVPLLDSEGDTKNYEFKNIPRMAALKELLEQITPHHKVLIWSIFRENYGQIKRVAKELGLSYVECHGEVSDAQKRESVSTFQTDPSVRLYIGHPGSGGIGVTLTEASYAIFYSRNFSLEYDLQAESRNHRGGSEKHATITRIDLVCPGTIDEVVLTALSNKMKISDEVVFSLAKDIKRANSNSKEMDYVINN